MGYNNLSKRIHNLAVIKGWWINDFIPFGQFYGNVHSEIGEASDQFSKVRDCLYYIEDKPEGWGIELSDAVIRILDFTGNYEIDIDDVIFKVSNIHLNFNYVDPIDYCNTLHTILSKSYQSLIKGKSNWIYLLAIFILLVDKYIKENSEYTLCKLISTKFEYNKNRPFRHGNKRY